MAESEGNRKGSFLERIIGRVFQKIGFNTKLNSREFGFEADVIARKMRFTVLIETKQYDSSYLNVGSLIHEWASKGKLSGVDRTLLVITGLKNIPEKYQQLAKSLGVYIWDEETVHRLNDLDSKELYDEIGTRLKFTDVIAKRNAQMMLIVKIALFVGVIFMFFLFINNQINDGEGEEITSSNQQVGGVELPYRSSSENPALGSSEIVVEQNPEEKLKQYCTSKFNEKWTKTTIYSLNYFWEYNSAYNWAEMSILSTEQQFETQLEERGASVEESVQQKLRLLIKPLLDKANFPIVIIDGGYQIDNSVSAKGLIICDQTGIIEH